MNTKPYRPYSGKKRRLPIVLLCLLLIFALTFAGLRVFISLGSKGHIQGDPQVMIIFGCKVDPVGPSQTLKDRLDAALYYLDDHPGMTVVVTGGKGDDEHLSEARCMADYLIDHGIDESSILLEDQATNTWENVLYTLSLMERRGISTAQGVLLVSSDFHLARIRMLWKRGAGSLDAVSTLAAPVTHLGTQFQMFFREPAAVISSFFMNK